jgi:hypothetical protein
MDYGEALMFEPSGRDMKMDYPELAETDEFKELSQRQLKFVWYVANRTSPLASLSGKKRLKAAASTAWGSYHAKKQEAIDYAEGKFPDEIKAAIEKMASFIPSVRLKAKFMQEYIFDKMQSIIIVSDNDMEEMDADEKKKYADLALKVSSELGNVVDRLESGYGVKVKETKKKGNEVKRTVSDVIDKIN